MTDITPQHDPAVTTLTAKAGDKVDNYTIMEQVGAGGTAIVFRGHDHVLNRDVAIKQLVIPPGDAGDDIRQRALTEAASHKRAAAADPHLLVQYVDSINDPRGLFLISEYVDGPSLEWILQQETGPMDQRQALGIIAATAKALGALHNSGMVHRDLKPSNVLMPREGGLKLADFGLAAIVAEQQSMDLGSVRYMAPEVLQGQPASPQSDLYSLGIIAYEMLAGRDNFNDAFRTILRDQRNQAMRWVKWHTNARAKVTPLNQMVDNIPDTLAQVVARMMEKDPARRVGSANELLEAIRNFFASGGQEQPSPHAAMAPPKIEDVSQTAEVPQRSKLPVILGAMLVVWVIAIGGFFYWKNEQEKAAQQQAVQALIDDVESADRLIADQDYEGARNAFAQILTVHEDMFDGPDTRREDLVVAGRLKADALLAASKNDFIAALKHAQEYEKRMSRLNPPPTSPNTSLSKNNADKLIDAYSLREAFQRTAEEIEAMLAAGELDSAIQKIRRTLNNSTDATAEEDRQRLLALERQYKQLLDGERIVALLDEARELRDDGDLRDAIRLLEDEVDESGEDVDERVTALLAELNRAERIAQIQEDIDDAKQEGDLADELAALEKMQNIQPTNATSVRIRELKNTIDLEAAETAIEEGRPELARQLLNRIKERDPENPHAARLLTMIADAERMKMAVTRGDQDLADGNYQSAIKNYKTALTFGPDSDGSINKKIQTATGRYHTELSEAALEAGDVAKAQDELDKAKAALGETSTITSLQARIDNLRDYTVLVKEGDDWFSKKSYGRAKAKYIAARKIFESETINQKISDCDFGTWLDQCDQAIQTRDWEAAESALRRAEEIKKNAETAARREQINNRIR